MATPESDAALEDAPEEEGAEGEERPRLELDVQVEKPSACQRHITVTIPRQDVDRYLTEAVDEMLPKAAVPGFRAGRARGSSWRTSSAKRSPSR